MHITHLLSTFYCNMPQFRAFRNVICLKMCNRQIQILDKGFARAFHMELDYSLYLTYIICLSQAVCVTMLHLPGDYILACIHKQRGLYNLHIHYWLIQYKQIHYHPSPFMLYPNRAVEGLLCSWDVALNLSEGNLCILIEATVLLLHEIVTWIDKTTLFLSCCDGWYNHLGFEMRLRLSKINQKALICLQEQSDYRQLLMHIWYCNICNLQVSIKTSKSPWFKMVHYFAKSCFGKTLGLHSLLLGCKWHVLVLPNVDVIMRSWTSAAPDWPKWPKDDNNKFSPIYYIIN